MFTKIVLHVVVFSNECHIKILIIEFWDDWILRIMQLLMCDSRKRNIWKQDCYLVWSGKRQNILVGIELIKPTIQVIGTLAKNKYQYRALSPASYQVWSMPSAPDFALSGHEFSTPWLFQYWLLRYKHLYLKGDIIYIQCRLLAENGWLSRVI